MTFAFSEGTHVELQDYLKIVRRRKWVIIEAFVVVLVAAVVASLFQTRIYESTATLLVREQDLGSTLFGQIMPELSMQPERGLQTQLDLVKLRPIAEATIQELDLKTTPDQLLSKVTVDARPQSNLMTIGVQDPDPKAAQRLANTLAEQYILWNRTLNTQDIVAARDEVKLKMTETEKNLVGIAKRIGKAGGTNNMPEDLRAQWGMATQLYSMLAEKYEQLRILSATNSGGSVLVAPGIRPNAPVKPNIPRNGALGAILGLALGIGFAFVFEHLDDSIKSKADIEEILGLPVMGQIPLNKTAAATGLREIVVNSDRFSAAAEAYRILRSNLHYSGVDNALRTFAVTSPGPEEGKTTVTANLAAAFATAGKKTRVLCCDLRKPVGHDIFQVPDREGLTDVLCDNVPLAGVIRIEKTSGIEVVTSGPIPPDPSELLGSKRMGEVLVEAGASVDVLLLDTPPVGGVSDTLELASRVDGVLLVVNANKTPREAAKRALETLRGVDANVIGVVLNGMELGSTYGYGYGYYGYHKAGAQAVDAAAASPGGNGEGASVEDETIEEKTPLT